MSHTIGRRTTVIAVAAAVLSLLSPAGRAHGAAPSEVRSQTLVIDQDDRSAFGIKEVRWVETSATVPAHAYILGCHGCGSASYASSGELNDPLSLHRIPTSYVLRVPVNYNAKLVANIPPGASTHTFFRARHAQLLAEGYAVAVMDHPMPGFPRFPYEQFFRPPYSTGGQLFDLRAAGLAGRRSISSTGVLAASGADMVAGVRQRHQERRPVSP